MSVCGWRIRKRKVHPLVILGLGVGFASGGIECLRDQSSEQRGPLAAVTSPCTEGLSRKLDPRIHCAELIPTPDVRLASGFLELRPASSPFGIATTRDGHVRHNVAIVVDGLPEASALGGFTTYVAWMYTMSLDSVVKLGEIRNGRTEVGQVFRNQFRVLVTAEPSAAVAERTGQLVLRTTSPSALLLGHIDIAVLEASDSAPALTPAGAEPDAHAVVSGWFMPPMRPSMPMIPGLRRLQPHATPFLPGLDVPLAAIPEARPRTLVEMESGDTLNLKAMLVRRTINGKVFRMYGFNGQYPGPLIKVEQGATIVVKLTNEIELPTSIHWHGVRIENRFDGVPGVTQAPVQPGETFVYRIHFRDAGIYWYHPHHREVVQQDLGLYGNMLVTSPDADYFGPVNREEVVMLDDLLVGEEGLVPFGVESPTHALMGRFGNVFLVNGEPDYQLSVRRGEVVRFFVTNVANTRTFNLVLNGVPLKVIGSDIGKFEREEWVESVVIAPAERYILEARFPESGEVAVTNRVQALNHIYGSFAPEVDTLGWVQVSQEPVAPDHRQVFERLRVNHDVVAEIDPYRSEFGRPVDHELEIGLRLQNLPPPTFLSMNTSYFPPVEWNDGMPVMNWLTTGHEVEWVLLDPATGRENMDIDWRFTQGEVVKIRLRHPSGFLHAMDHPIHIHGQRFLILERDGQANGNLVWKDTVVIPVGSTVDILLELSNPGRWMLHCHVAEHLGVGMGMVFEVEPR